MLVVWNFVKRSSKTAGRSSPRSSPPTTSTRASRLSFAPRWLPARHPRRFPYQAGVRAAVLAPFEASSRAVRTRSLHGPTSRMRCFRARRWTRRLSSGKVARDSTLHAPVGIERIQQVSQRVPLRTDHITCCLGVRPLRQRLRKNQHGTNA